MYDPFIRRDGDGAVRPKRTPGGELSANGIVAVPGITADTAKPYSSVYFLLLPRAFSAGYFIALSAIFSRTAAERSMPVASERYSR